MEAVYGILIPFLGTSLGAACVFFMKKTLSDLLQRSLTGFAAGGMVAASVWSLLIPAMEQSAGMGTLSFLPALLGFWIGIGFLFLLDHAVPHLHQKSGQVEGPKRQLRRTTMMVLAVTLHNIPEGMAVGVVYAGYLSGQAQITAAGALALSLGIAIQNFPEGAIISMPLRAEGMKKSRAFWGGVLSGVVEPIGAFLTILAAFILCMPERPQVEPLTEYYAKAMMTAPARWAFRQGGNTKFTPKDIAHMKANAALRAADRNPYSWNMDFLPYPGGNGYEARFYRCGICVLMKELGLYDLTPALCHLDYTMADAMCVVDFQRQYTLASGGPYCDCGYKKKRNS